MQVYHIILSHVLHQNCFENKYGQSAYSKSCIIHVHVHIHVHWLFDMYTLYIVDVLLLWQTVAIYCIRVLSLSR